MNKLILNLSIAILACASIAQAQITAAAKPTQAKKESGQASPAKSTSASPASKPDIKTDEDCGCELKGLPDVLAIVNGVKITSKEIDEHTSTSVSSLKQRVVEARKRELDLEINSKLLAAEAKKRGISPTNLIEEEVVAKVKEPNEAEAQAFFEQNKNRIQGEFQDVKNDIIGYLRNQRQRDEAEKLAQRWRAAAQVKVLVEKVTPPANTSERSRVFATINSEPITSGDIEDSLRPLIFNAQQQTYNLRKRELNSKINDILLEQEAQKRKITIKGLLDAELGPKVRKMTEADARKFYEQNKEKIAGDFAQLKDQIIQYLQEQEVTRAELLYAEQLRQGTSIQMFLTPPVPPTYTIATDDQPSKGNATAPVTIVEFTDYQCPSCAQTQPLIERLVIEYGDKVKLIVRDYPLEQHANAFKAAEAAEAARAQGKYWEYVNVLFNNQPALGTEKLKEYASQLGLDRKGFEAALDSGKFADKVRRDLQDGLRIGVNGTPTLFINGRQVMENSYENLKRNVEAALRDGEKK